jgi:hypothetical protein
MGIGQTTSAALITYTRMGPVDGVGPVRNIIQWLERRLGPQGERWSSGWRYDPAGRITWTIETRTQEDHALVMLTWG